MKKKIISLIVCLLLLTGCDGGSASYKTITENEATELISNNAVIIDVRGNIEYESGHIVGAINIPVDNIGSVDYDKDKALEDYGLRGLKADQYRNEILHGEYRHPERIKLNP